MIRGQANRLGLVDKPGGRKQHRGHIPIVGGLCVYLSVVLSGFMLNFNWGFFLPLVVGLPIVIVGVLDDRFALSMGLRISTQLAVALGMIFIGQIEINSIGNITGTGDVNLGGAAAVVFTVMSVVGVINSINMIDGVDGLSGSLIGLSLLPLTLFAWLSLDQGAVTLLLSLIAALLAFLLYNSRLFRSHASVFLGDGGSTFLGFILVWYLIKYTQGHAGVLSPVSAGWILGLPLADTIVVMVRRLWNKSSPFTADRKHLHHRFLDAGLGPNKTVLLMLGIQSVFIGIGFLSNTLSGTDPLFFWAFVVVTVAHFAFTPRIVTLMANFKNRQPLKST